MKKTLALILCLCIFAQLSQALANTPNAWWLDIEFKPTQHSIAGKPLGQFNKEWESAELLSSTDLSSLINSKDFSEFKSSRFSFEKRVDLNKNGKKERIVVGVYQRLSGERGRFVAIFEQNKLIKTLTEDGNAGFSALLIDKGQVYWYFCMQCGGGYKLIWDGKDYFLD